MIFQTDALFEMGVILKTSTVKHVSVWYSVLDVLKAWVYSLCDFGSSGTVKDLEHENHMIISLYSDANS